MIIYHGSKDIIKSPVFHGGKPYNDYGFGFYCTEHSEMAAEWSVTPDHDGYINEYELDETGLSILDLNDEPILTWLSILLENRTFDLNTPLAREAKRYIIDEFCIDYESYDLIKGYRADDSYFSFAQDFINGTISLDQLGSAMHLGELGNQTVLKSKKAFKHIKFVKAKRVLRSEWLAKKQLRDETARRKYTSIDKEKYNKGALYITKIIDEEIKKDDARLQ